MELKTDNKYFISKEEYDFLQEAKKELLYVRNKWFKDGRVINSLFVKLETLQKGVQNEKENSEGSQKT